MFADVQIDQLVKWLSSRYIPKYDLTRRQAHFEFIWQVLLPEALTMLIAHIKDVTYAEVPHVIEKHECSPLEEDSDTELFESNVHIDVDTVSCFLVSNLAYLAEIWYIWWCFFHFLKIFILGAWGSV